MANAPRTASLDQSRAVSYQKKSRGFGGLFSKVGDAFSRMKSKKSAGNTSVILSKIKVCCLL